MHPQTLRIYEGRPDHPEALAGSTGLYSEEDVERLRRIQELTSELGMNLAGVEQCRARAGARAVRRRMRAFQRHAERVQQELRAEMERVRRSVKRRAGALEPASQALMPRGRGVR